MQILIVIVFTFVRRQKQKFDNWSLQPKITKMSFQPKLFYFQRIKS